MAKVVQFDAVGGPEALVLRDMSDALRIVIFPKDGG
jgi:hypothetical protein